MFGTTTTVTFRCLVPPLWLLLGVWYRCHGSYVSSTTATVVVKRTYYFVNLLLNYTTGEDRINVFGLRGMLQA